MFSCVLKSLGFHVTAIVQESILGVHERVIDRTLGLGLGLKLKPIKFAVNGIRLR